MSHRPSRSLTLLLLCGMALLALGGLAGCSGGDSRTTAEIDEPDFRRGQELKKAGRNQEALVAFQRVLIRRGEDAPESHLELGLICLQQLKDPLTAVYHFNEFIRLRPNSPQAPLVKQQIAAARREFGRTLPAQPLDNQFERLDLLATVDRLKRENEELKEQLAAQQSLHPVEIPRATRAESAAAEPAPRATAAPVPATRAAAPGAFAFHLDGRADAVPVARAKTPAADKAEPDMPVAAPAPKTEAHPPAVTLPSARRTQPSQASAPRATATRPAATAPAASPKAERIHTVGRSDTLMSLALRYYGSRSSWRKILDANRDQLSGDSPTLKVGMKLKVP